MSIPCDVRVSKGDIATFVSDVLITTINADGTFGEHIEEVLATRLKSFFLEKVRTYTTLGHGSIIVTKAAAATFAHSFKNVLCIVDEDCVAETLCFVIYKALVRASEQGFTTVTLPPIRRPGMAAGPIVSEMLCGIRMYREKNPASVINKIDIVVPQEEDGLEMMFAMGLLEPRRR